jgi:hypothetical protein
VAAMIHHDEDIAFGRKHPRWNFVYSALVVLVFLTLLAHCDREPITDQPHTREARLDLATGSATPTSVVIGDAISITNELPHTR